MAFTPSKYQQAIYTFIREGTGNAVIDAVAGSGKSTTIVNALKLIPSTQSVLFLAFNKAIVEELKIKVGNLSNVEIKTLHSLGAGAIMKQIRTNIQSDKYRTWLNTGLKFGGLQPLMDLEYEELSEYKSNILKLIDLLRVNLCNSSSDMDDLVYKHGLDLIDNELDIAKKAINWGLKEMGQIDFTDMIYFPNVRNIKMPQYDWVFIDECQDLNAAQREMFLKCVKPGGRFIAVGDPRQAIYGFAGADVKSFNILKATPNTTEFPLSVCYRCDSDIIDLAKTLVHQIEARDNAPQGVVNHEASIKDVQDGDMILCRVTAPLASLCMKYIGQGIKAYIKGKDIGTNLINMINKTKRTNIMDALQIMDKELNKIAQRVSSQQKCSLAEAKLSNQYTIYEDKIKAIEVVEED
jgi:superfamily I DNA/RNA helicase